MERPSRVLVLLYSTRFAADKATLRAWSRYKNGTRFRDELLAKLQQCALIHFRKRTSLVRIPRLASIMS